MAATARQNMVANLPQVRGCKVLETSSHQECNHKNMCFRNGPPNGCQWGQEAIEDGSRCHTSHKLVQLDFWKRINGLVSGPVVAYRDPAEAKARYRNTSSSYKFPK